MAGMSTQKKVLLGCGGCLGVMLVLALLMGGLTIVGFQSYQASSQRVTETLFGEALPEGYAVVTAIDAHIQIAVLKNDAERKNLIITREPIPEKRVAYYRDMTPKKMQSLAEVAIQAGEKFNPSPAKVTGITTLTLFGKPYPAGTMVYNVSGNDIFMPALIVFLPTDDRHVVSFIMQSLEPSTNENETFEESYPEMAESLRVIIENAAFADNLVLPQQEAASGQEKKR